VLLGLYGQWHGAKEWKDITVDLGFVLSNDGLYFREPLRDWTFLPCGEEGEWDQGGVLQGQGFENIGDETFFYYGAWDPRARGQPRGGIGIAKLPRDRFASLRVDNTAKGPGNYQQPSITSELVTKTLSSITSQQHRFLANVSGLGAEAKLKIEVLDEREQPLERYSGNQAAWIDRDGFQQPIAWDGQTAIRELPEKYHLRLTFVGNDSQTIRFHALYIDDEQEK
jgi:hypothetical protein